MLHCTPIHHLRIPIELTNVSPRATASTPRDLPHLHSPLRNSSFPQPSPSLFPSPPIRSSLSSLSNRTLRTRNRSRSHRRNLLESLSDFDSTPSFPYTFISHSRDPEELDWSDRRWRARDSRTERCRRLSIQVLEGGSFTSRRTLDWSQRNGVEKVETRSYRRGSRSKS